MVTASILLVAYLAVLGVASQLPPLAEVTVPTIDKFELVASDGTPLSSGQIYNHWGGHQTRITHHSDGTIRLVFLYLNATNSPQWRLMKKVGDAGAWTEEASGPTTDDVYLFRDPATDQVYVVTSPSTTRQSILTSPSFTATDIPGAWPLQGGRRYGGAGLGPDGTLCIKNFQNLPGGAYTLTTNTVYMCGNNNAGTWTWHPLVTHYLGVRHAYDVVFPGAIKGYPGFVGVAQRDTLATSEGYVNAASNAYLFNGVKYYRTGYDSNNTWAENYLTQPIDDPFKMNDTIGPTKRPTNTFIDSHGYIITSYYVTNPRNASQNGMYVVVSDVDGSVLLDKMWSFLPTYGKTVIFEDGGQQLWMIWLNRGITTTQLQLFTVDRVTSPTFDLTVTNTTGTDLSAATGTSAGNSGLYLTGVRSGTEVSNYVDALMVTCGNYPNLAATCNASTPEQIFYLRIRLPGSGIAPPSSDYTPVEAPFAEVSPSFAPLGTTPTKVSAANSIIVQVALLLGVLCLLHFKQ